MAQRMKTKDRERQLLRRHRRVRRKLAGTTERPRLVVHRSAKNMQGHLADDATGRILMGVSTQAGELREQGGTKKEQSKAAGKLLGEKALAAGIKRVVFDRGGYLYHGRIAAFAEGAREAGLEF